MPLVAYHVGDLGEREAEADRDLVGGVVDGTRRRLVVHQQVRHQTLLVRDAAVCNTRRRPPRATRVSDGKHSQLHNYEVGEAVIWNRQIGWLESEGQSEKRFNVKQHRQRCPWFMHCQQQLVSM